MKKIPYSQRFKDRKPKIFVGLLAFGDVDPRVLSSWVVWAFQQPKLYNGRFHVRYGDALRKEQYRGRNNLIRDAFIQGADFLVMVDDDQLVGDCPTMLGDFYDLEKPVQCTLSMQRGNSPYATVLKEEDDKIDFVPLSEIPEEPAPVQYAGGGCTWVDMEVFDYLMEPHWWPFPQEPEQAAFIPDTTLGLDLHFCKRVREDLGEEVWLNTNVTMGHLEHERSVVQVPGRRLRKAA